MGTPVVAAAAAVLGCDGEVKMSAGLFSGGSGLVGKRVGNLF